MTVIDVLIIGFVGTSLGLFIKHRPNALFSRAYIGLGAIVCGLVLTGLFYLTDLAVMHLLPFFVPMNQAMAVMETLHLNYSWIAIPCVVGLIATGFAVTNRSLFALIDRLRSSENQLQALNQDLEQRIAGRVQELNVAQEELMRKSRLAALGQITGTVSHELRNPLGALRASITVISNLAGDEATTMRQAVDIANRSILRCDEIIGDLLEYSRVRPLHLREVGLNEWIADVLDELKLPDDVELVRSFTCEQALSVDPDRLRRVVTNVVDNAVQAMAADDGRAPAPIDKLAPRLTVSTHTTVSRAELRFTDNGPGMDQETIRKIFEPLYSTKASGVGLGLTLVKQIMEQHAGGVEFESAPGKGTKTVLWLPLPEPAWQAAS
jgi:signal transduction histidine kinase